MKTLERRRCSGVFTINSEYISHLVVSIVNFEHVISGWDSSLWTASTQNLAY